MTNWLRHPDNGLVPASSNNHVPPSAGPRPCCRWGLSSRKFDVTQSHDKDGIHQGQDGSWHSQSLAGIRRPRSPMQSMNDTTDNTNNNNITNNNMITISSPVINITRFSSRLQHYHNILNFVSSAHSSVIRLSWNVRMKYKLRSTLYIQRFYIIRSNK